MIVQEQSTFDTPRTEHAAFLTTSGLSLTNIYLNGSVHFQFSDPDGKAPQLIQDYETDQVSVPPRRFNKAMKDLIRVVNQLKYSPKDQRGLKDEHMRSAVHQ